MKTSKIYLGVCSLLLACFLVCGSILNPLVTYANVLASGSNALASDSNAIMTLELGDDDYGVSTLSSIGTVTNTIDSNSLPVSVQVTNGSGNTQWINVVAYLEDGRYVINKVSAPNGYYVTRIQPTLYSKDLPSAGTYTLSFDYSSDISYDVNGMSIFSIKYPNNAADQSNVIPIDSFVDDSGEVYVAPMGIQLTNLSQLAIAMGIPQSEYVSTVGGSFAINFTVTSSNSNYPSTAGSNTSTSDYQSDVSSSLSGISSGMAEQAESIQNVADAISNLSASMEPHYGEVLTQLHHITEQLHAFWDQQYNLHHVPLMAKLDSLVSALTNMDTGLGGKIDSLITEVNTQGQSIYAQLQSQRGKLSSEIQNKLQAVQEALQSTLNSNTTTLFDQMFDQRNKLDSHIKGYVSEQTDMLTDGYDKSEMQSENEEFAGAVNGLDQAEKEVLDDVTGYINDFEYTDIGDWDIEVVEALSFIGSFMTRLFYAMDDFGLVITMSLTLTFVLIIVGYHRIRA